MEWTQLGGLAEAAMPIATAQDDCRRYVLDETFRACVLVATSEFVFLFMECVSFVGVQSQGGSRGQITAVRAGPEPLRPWLQEHL